MRSRSSFCLIGAIFALAGLASAGIAQGQGSPPAAPTSLLMAAAPRTAPVLPGAVKYMDGTGAAAPAQGLATLAAPSSIQPNPDFAKAVTAAPYPVVKMSAGRWLYLAGKGGGTKPKVHQVTLWISDAPPTLRSPGIGAVIAKP